jgi:hypothetical protein
MGIPVTGGQEVFVDRGGGLWVGEPKGAGDYEITPTPVKVKITQGNIVVTEHDEGHGVVIGRIQEQPSKPGDDPRTVVIEVGEVGKTGRKLGRFTVREREWRKTQDPFGMTIQDEKREKVVWE